MKPARCCAFFHKSNDPTGWWYHHVAPSSEYHYTSNYLPDLACSQDVGAAWSRFDLVDLVHHVTDDPALMVNGQSAWVPSLDTGGGCNLEDHTYFLALKRAHTAPPPTCVWSTRTSPTTPAC